MDECQSKGTLEWTQLCLQITLSILIVTGNFFVILSILVVKVLRHSRNYLIMSVAVADLLVGITVIPCKISLAENCKSWVGRRVVCYIWACGSVMLCTASILGLTAISIDRYIAIGKPLFHRIKFTAKKIYIVVAIIWILALATTIIPVRGLYTQHKFVIDDIHPYACVHYQDAWLHIVGVVTTFFVPLGILIFVCVTIIQILKHQESKFRKELQPAPYNEFPTVDEIWPNVYKAERNGYGSSDCSSANSVCRFLEEKKGCIITGVVVLAFAVCWLPYFALVLTQAIFHVTGRELIIESWLEIFGWLGYFNSCANPIIYTIFHKDFRLAFKHLLRFRCSTVNRRMRHKIYTKQAGCRTVSNCVSVTSTSQLG